MENPLKKNQYCIFCDEVMKRVWWFKPTFSHHQGCLDDRKINWEYVYDAETDETYLRMYLGNK